jgi:phage I-like protein
VVAPASRGGKPAQKETVTLTASEVEIANRLGVPLKEYAAQKLKGQTNG